MDIFEVIGDFFAFIFDPMVFLWILTFAVGMVLGAWIW